MTGGAFLHAVAECPPRLGRYELVLELGEGALGVRWAGLVAEGPERGRLVSVRRVPLPVGVPDPRASLVAAAHRARSLRHPKLAAVLDVVELADELALVSETVSEGMEVLDLGAMLALAAREKSPIPPPVALTIARDVLQGLAAASGLWVQPAAETAIPSSAIGSIGPLHGGLAPDGILVAAFGETLIAEIGVATAAFSTDHFCRHPAALPYRAPEQLRNRSLADERSDVFTMGVLLWEMLANRPLFGPSGRFRKGEPAQEAPPDDSVLLEVLEKPIPGLDGLQRPGTPLRKELAAFVARALEREPARRFQSLREMLAAIESLPHQTLASAETTAAYVERLGHDVLTARRAALARTVRTAACLASCAIPQPPASARGQDILLVDRDSQPASVPRMSRFPATEAPTVPGSALAARCVETPAPCIVGESVAGEISASPAATSAFVASVPPSARSGRRLGLAASLTSVIILALLVAGMLVWFQRGKGSPPETAQAPTEVPSQPAAALPEGGSQQVAEPAASGARPQPPPTETPNPAGRQDSEKTPGPLSTGKPARREDRPEPAAPPGPAKRSFRPSGI